MKPTYNDMLNFLGELGADKRHVSTRYMARLLERRMNDEAFRELNYTNTCDELKNIFCVSHSAVSKGLERAADAIWKADAPMLKTIFPCKAQMASDAWSLTARLRPSLWDFCMYLEHYVEFFLCA